MHIDRLPERIIIMSSWWTSQGTGLKEWASRDIVKPLTRAWNQTIYHTKTGVAQQSAHVILQSCRQKLLYPQNSLDLDYADFAFIRATEAERS